MSFRVIAPAGRGPHQLAGTDQASVSEWVEKLKTTIPGTNYSFEAYRYWIRHSYDINSDEFRDAAASLAVVMGQA